MRLLYLTILNLVFPLLPDLLACSVCFGDPQSKTTQAAKAGILFLLIVIGAVLSAIGGVIFTWSRRARRLNDEFPSPAAHP